MRTDEPVVDIDQTHAGVFYGVTEDVPEQVRTLIEGLQAPTRLGRDVTWGEHFGAMDAISVEVLWDEEDQRATYRVPGTQRRSVALSDLAEELGRDWERYLADRALVSELLGRLDAVTPAGIDTEEEMTTWFNPQARTVIADIDLAPVPTPDGLPTPGLRGRITVSSHTFDLDLEGSVPARQLGEADARMVLADAVARANQDPIQVAYDEMRPHLAPFLDRGLEIADPIVTPDGTVRMQILTPAADAGDCLGIARTEQAVTFCLNHNKLVIRPGGSLTRQLREKGLDASDEDSLWGLSPDLATDPDVREMTDAEAAATILGMRPEAFDAASRGVELGLRNAEKELAHRRAS
jgi:hypothetical protein